MRLRAGSALVVFAAAFLSCVPNVRKVGQGNAAVGAWDRLRRSRSFAFRLHYRTDIPIGIECNYAGRWQTPDREEWVGRYVRAGEVSAIRLLAAGESQYEMTVSGWRKSARGVETKVFEQAMQALQGVVLEPAGEEGGRYIFRFAPKATILDPAQTRSLEGRFEVDAMSGLPLTIAYGDESGLMRWKMDFSRINRAGTVRVPFVPGQILVAAPTRGLTFIGWSQAARILQGRLRRAGMEFRLRRKGRGLELGLADACSPDELELLFSRGKVELWEAEWGGQDSADRGGLVVVIKGDAARTVRLRRLVAANERLAVEVDKVLPARPELVVPVSGVRDGALAVLMVDGEAVGVARADAGGSLRFAELGSVSVVEMLAAATNGPPLPVGFRIRP